MPHRFATAALTSLLLTSLGTAAHAQDAGVAAYADAALEPALLANTEMVNELESYKRNSLRDTFTGPATRIEYAVSTVTVPTNHPHWNAARISTYADAWNQAQTKFLRTQVEAIESTVVRRIYEDVYGTPPTYKPEGYTGSDLIDELVDKGGAFVRAKLDTALKDVGVDPAQYDRAEPKQRKVMLDNAIQEEVITRAVGSLKGFWQLKSMTSTTATGQTVIGVAGVYSPSFEAIGAAILQGQTTIDTSKAGKPLAERLNLPDEILVNQFGVRVLHDEKGHAVLVSFGHADLPRNGLSQATMGASISNATNAARSMANRQIAEFLAGSQNFSDRSLVSQTVKRYMEVGRDRFVDDATTTNFERIVSGLTETRAKVTIGGLEDFKTWVAPHPATGHYSVGVVRVWTLQASDAARLVRNGARATSAANASTAPPTKQAKEAKAWTAESVDL